MDADRFESLLRSLFTSPTRRSALRLLTGLVLGSPLALSADAPAHNALKKCKKKSGKQKKTCVKKAKQHNAQHQPTPVPVLIYQCPGPRDEFQLTESVHFQSFTAPQSGVLHQIQFEVVQQANTDGPYQVELRAADADGTPTTNVLATATVPSVAQPVDTTLTVTANFAGPQLLAGFAYAAAITRLGVGSDDNIQVTYRTGNRCVGRAFEEIPGFVETFEHPNLDYITAVTVLV